MIAKKNSRADLERKRGVLFQIGLLTAGSFTLAAFTYTTPLKRMEHDRYVEAQQIEYEVVEREKPEEKIFEQPQTQTNQQNQNNQQSQSNASQQVTQNVTQVNNTNNVTKTTVTPPGGDGVITGDIVKIDDDKIIDVPVIDASFPGGYAAMVEHINSVFSYPDEAMHMGDQGKVYVDFVVEKDGSITNVKISKKVAPSIDREAKRIVRTFPKWIPGEMEYGKVRTKVSLPIVFTLKNN